MFGVISKIDWSMSIGDLAQSVATLLGFIGTIWAVNRKSSQFYEVSRDNFYTELDRFYARILELAIAEPNLRDDPLRKIKDGQLNRAKYDAYAFLVWNFLETLRDRVYDRPDLRETWFPVIGAEALIHKGWFLEEMSSRAWGDDGHKFCANFRIFVIEEAWLDPEMVKREKLRRSRHCCTQFLDALPQHVRDQIPVE